MAQTRSVGRRRTIVAFITGCVAVGIALPPLVSLPEVRSGGAAAQGYQAAKAASGELPRERRQRLRDRLIRRVKDHMHEPASFEALETRYRAAEGRVRITLRFRGHAPLGASAEQIVEATMDEDSGTILSFRSEPAAGNE